MVAEATDTVMFDPATLNLKYLSVLSFLNVARPIGSTMPTLHFGERASLEAEIITSDRGRLSCRVITPN